MYLGGTPIAYKPTEPWKATAAHIGRTKPSRAPDAATQKRKKNDGRPPDTKKELLKPPKKTQKVTKQSVLTDYIAKDLSCQASSTAASPNPVLARAAYPWSGNSCWLDSSLQIVFITVNHDFADFAGGYQDIPKILGLRSLYDIFDKRRISEEQDVDTMLSTIRRKERDSFRKLLRTKKAIRSINEPESLLVRFNINF